LTTSADVAQLRAGTTAVVQAVQHDLAGYFGTLDLARPEKARDALLAYVPRLITVYGDAASTIAADWYEQTRAAQVAGGFRAVTVAAAGSAAVEGTVRYGAQHLFTDSPLQTLTFLAGAVQRQTMSGARDTIASNAARDPARPRYARVPTGAKTCEFCTMLASRGFVYASQASAGGATDFHDHCDCQIVPSWSKHPALAGYDPGHYYSLYQQGKGVTPN
jgi:hypothetical protein